MSQVKDWVTAALDKSTPAPTQGVRFREPGADGRGQQLGRATAILTYMITCRQIRAILLAKNRPALEDLLTALALVMDQIERDLGAKDILPQRWVGTYMGTPTHNCIIFWQGWGIRSDPENFHRIRILLWRCKFV